MGMSRIQKTRIAILTIVSFSSLAVLIIAARWILVTRSNGFGYYRNAVFAVATSVISLTVPAMLILDVFQRRAITSIIVVELGWLGLLSVMWLITTVTSSSYAVKYSLPCSNKIFEPLWWEFGCVDTDAVIGLAAFNFVGLTCYLTTLTTLCVLAQRRGSPVWTRMVKEANRWHVNVEATDQKRSKAGAVRLYDYPPAPRAAV